MNQGESLTQSAFLLAFDLRKGELTQRIELGHLLRATALAELLLAGNLADESGKARALTAPAAEHGALRAMVWEQVSDSKPRSWYRWVHDNGTAVLMVRDELAAARVINVERRRVLLFPVERITLREESPARSLAERVGRAIRGGRPVADLDEDIRVLAALAAAAQLESVLPSGREARPLRDRIRQLSAPIEPITTALRQCAEAARTAAASGYG
ncbi:GPP34 family phosphoprotein [Rhizohabitans arisaemae]|uniref:GPP34 family phosphoprotein n=1 Tax=Rhizohabitans arisaemae TaxID=2720610 RepID=UPI0024B27E17|nr:GPP34 family phosphoprotein [Rhizohabitans arisaemae]